MTVIDMPWASPGHRLPVSMRAVRRLLPRAGCGLPAAVLNDPEVAAWVRAHRVTVYVSDGGELDLASSCGVRRDQLVFRCGASGPLRDAVTSGVNRFVVSTDQHVDVLATCAHGNMFLLIDGAATVSPAPECLGVIGLHCDVDATGPLDWGAAAQRLLCRMAMLRSGGAALTRISLTGGPAAIWIDGHKPELRAIATAVDDAIDEGCARWRLPRPSVTFAPSCARTPTDPEADTAPG